MMNTRDPWRVPVLVAQIPESGLHREFEADQATREAMAEIAGLRNIPSASALFNMAVKRGGRVQVTGRVRARVGQTCVVTLDPIENEIDEQIDLIFAPSGQIAGQKIAHQSDLVDAPVTPDAETPDPPEPIINGVIDLGRLATDVLFLAIDPYPRKPDAVFEPHVEPAEPDDHPFAALKAMQREAASSAAPRKRPRPRSKSPTRAKRD
jgi:uncharacterized protein DUF177 involved in 23S rRNA accumulation